MPKSTDTAALGLSRTVLRILLKLNPLVGVFILALLVASLGAPEVFMRALGMGAEFGNIAYMLGMRLVMALGIVAVGLTHIVLSRLLAMVETVRDGDPFIVKNATRLQQIAWTVLAGEVLHVVIVLIARGMSTSGTPIDIRWELPVTRWVVVLMLFVLARVFETGARMRADLEGTV